MPRGTGGTTRRRPLVIGGERIRPGERSQIRLKFSESYLGASVRVPIQVIRAEQPGPRLLLTGCVHGDELNGMGILRELLFGAPLDLLRGTLIIVPVVNVFGLENHTRYLPDRRDLNRSFPGLAAGSISSRLAHVIFTELVQQSDYLIDLHTAAVRRVNYPTVRADLKNPEARMLAESFGCELLVDNAGPTGSLRRCASDAGVPSILLEAGEVWKIEPGVVKVGVRGILNVLKALRMIDGVPIRPLFQLTIGKSSWVRAEGGGTLSFAARPGDLVEKDQVIATIHNTFGTEKSQLVAPISGIVIGVTTMPVTRPGDAIYHIAALNRGLYAQTKKKIDEASRKNLFRLVHDDLAKNVHGLG